MNTRTKIACLRDDDLRILQRTVAAYLTAQNTNMVRGEMFEMEKKAYEDFLNFHTNILADYGIDRGEIEGFVYIDSITGNVYDVEESLY